MTRWLLGLLMAALSFSMLPEPAEAKRLGGGGSAGMQRSLPSRTPDATPAKPAPTPANAAAPAPRRSWMGPIAGLAAGLGIAALASHLGFGEEMANFLTIALLLMLALVVGRWLLRRFAPAPQGTAPRGLQFAGVPNGDFAAPPATAASGAGAAALPSGFDAAGFARTAKMIFIRLQAANDSGDLDDLRAFTTPELFASIRLDLQERQVGTQQTDVVQIDAEVLDVADEAQRQVVSVRFHGLIREQRDGAAAPFDEVWHLVRPNDGSREWAIAGIQQAA
ncbi:MAG: Tim44 domain-containing protein [Piscinibacter sp.]|nr:Tim44 domain-containing protein [Piscinibacter sp.]